MSGARLYFALISVSVRGQMQYRAAFLMQSAAQAASTAIEFAGLWALFDRFGRLRGWTLPEAAFFYGLVNIAFALADALSWGFDHFSEMVRSGEFDRMLVRPRPTALQVLGQELTLRRAGRLAQGAAALAWAVARLDADWTVARAALAGFAVAGGVCLFTGLVILRGATAFWTVESLEFWHAFTYGGVQLAQYPMAIYRPWFRKFFTGVVPLACTAYFPVVGALGKADPLGSAPWMQAAAPLAGALFLVFALRVWERGVRRYRSTGS